MAKIKLPNKPHDMEYLFKENLTRLAYSQADPARENWT